MNIKKKYCISISLFKYLNQNYKSGISEVKSEIQDMDYVNKWTRILVFPRSFLEEEFFLFMLLNVLKCHQKNKSKMCLWAKPLIAPLTKAHLR
jgi:hypothetical protein